MEAQDSSNFVDNFVIARDRTTIVRSHIQLSDTKCYYC